MRFGMDAINLNVGDHGGASHMGVAFLFRAAANSAGQRNTGTARA